MKASCEADNNKARRSVTQIKFNLKIIIFLSIDPWFCVQEIIVFPWFCGCSWSHLLVWIFFNFFILWMWINFLLLSASLNNLFGLKNGKEKIQYEDRWAGHAGYQIVLFLDRRRHDNVQAVEVAECWRRERETYIFFWVQR